MADNAYQTYVWTVFGFIMCLLLYFTCARVYVRESLRGAGQTSHTTDVVVVHAQSASPQYPTAEARLSSVQSATPAPNAKRRGEDVVYVSRVEVVQEQKSEDIETLFV